jgi:hypothetical protein
MKFGTSAREIDLTSYTSGFGILKFYFRLGSECRTFGIHIPIMQEFKKNNPAAGTSPRDYFFCITVFFLRV